MKIKIALLCWATVLGGAFAETKPLLEDELNRFHIPGATLDEADLGSVVKSLESSYRKYAKVVPESERELTIEVSEGVEAKLTGKVPSQSIRATLYQIAGQAGCSLSFGESKVTLTMIPKNAEQGEFQILVPPNFIKQLTERAEVPRVVSDWVNGPATTSSHLSRVFREMGLFVEGKSSVGFDPKSARLTFKATGHERQRVEVFLKSMNHLPKQIRVTSRIVSGPGELPLQVGEFRPLEVQTMVRAASFEKGTEFLTLPSLVMLPGDEAKFEMMANDALFDDDAWTGPKLHFELDLRGSGISGELQFLHRVGIPDLDGKVEERSLRRDIQLRDGDTFVEKISTKDGSSEYLMTTVEVIDATGRRVRNQSLIETTQPSSK